MKALRPLSLTKPLMPGLPLAGLSLLSACASGFRPCQDGGDLSWPGITRELKGDTYCHQKQAGKKFVNHGRFKIFDRQGKPLLEGEFFEGMRQGTWIQYNDQGEKIAQKFFERGIEKPITPAAPSKPPAPLSH